MLRRLGNVARTAGGNRTSRQRRRHSGGGSVRGSVGGSSSGGGGEGGEGGGSSSRAIVSAIAAAAHRRGLDLAVGLTLQVRRSAECTINSRGECALMVGPTALRTTMLWWARRWRCRSCRAAARSRSSWDRPVTSGRPFSGRCDSRPPAATSHERRNTEANAESGVLREKGVPDCSAEERTKRQRLRPPSRHSPPCDRPSQRVCRPGDGGACCRGGAPRARGLAALCP